MTPKQAETLRAVAEGKVCQINCGYAAWRIQGASPTVVGRLISKGLVQWGKHGGDQIDAFLTDAGREALIATPEPQP